MTATRCAVVAFVAAAAAGPWYTAAGYSVVHNVISELAAQNTPNRLVMVAAFVALGAAIVVDGLRAFRMPLLPFIAFGLCFGAAGLFGHRPITPGVPYSEWMDTVHSALATASGVALTIGFAWQWAAARTPARWTAGLLALACVGLPLVMLWHPAAQGIVQRFMYLLVFAWLWHRYPARTPA